ncbi:hypothetical protein DPMN_169234 [Dreissena polymorpha]|uniref:Uncharacterized protein n=1 Tax=Dreissena polymorpha TaxID=45954 RepID=A0A9D4F492_DREPO|nr:hypothetical protein DPMN_169234 [Dreissena polymorpha]
MIDVIQVNHLSLIGGSNRKKTLQIILERLMSKRLRCKFFSKGVKGKLSFDSSEMQSSSAMKSNTENVTEHKIKELISYHLKYAPHWKGGGKRYIYNYL